MHTQKMEKLVDNSIEYRGVGVEYDVGIMDASSE